ncbi:MAG: psp operon transcriptional activator [Alphaproteobacteria bacterium]|jgi:psp operon transcriptional activator
MFKQNDNLIGQANSFLEILEQTSMVAPLDKPVLVIGERGTGKELIAARLHFLSKRWEENYVKLNCAALNDNLLESELFGYEAGAFTGASKRREGRFEYAHQGTLFLDELANTSPLIQEKLLRVIEYGEFERVGGSRSVKVDVRIIAATNEDLPTLAEAGEFRPDLLDRLAFDVITIPPLRERQADIMMLAEHFAINMARELELELFAGFSKKSRDLLLDYSWPGNVRELKNVVERAVYRTPPNVPVHDIILNPFESKYRPQQRTKIKKSSTVDVAEVSAMPTTNTAPEHNDATALFGGVSEPTGFEFPIDLKQASQDYEIGMLQQALEDSQYNQKKTAEKLSLTYHQLRGYLKKYNLLENTEPV